MKDARLPSHAASAARVRVSRKDFPALFASKKRSSGRFLTLIGSSELAGDAVVVSKKVARTAVARNRLRRVIRAALRADDGYNGAVAAVVKAGATSVPARTLREETRALKRRLA